MQNDNQLFGAPQGEGLHDIFASANNQPFTDNQLVGAPTGFVRDEIFGEVAREPLVTA